MDPKTIKSGATAIKVTDPFETPPTLVLVDGISAEQRPVLRFDFFEFEEDDRPIFSFECFAKADLLKQDQAKIFESPSTTAFEPVLNEADLTLANFAVISVILPPGIETQNQKLKFSFFKPVGYTYNHKNI